MTVSLVGIISIQVVWISKSIDEQKKEFALHVNDALNRLNTSISDDETFYYIDEHFGGMDSLLRQVTVNHTAGKKGKNGTRIQPSSPEHQEHHIEFGFEHNTVGAEGEESGTSESSSWVNKVEIRIDEEDTVRHITKIEHKGLDTFHMRKLTTIMDQFSFEKSLTGRLSDRITQSDLRSKLRKSLQQEGIDSGFEFAVYDGRKKQLDSQFVTTGYASNDSLSDYRKTLFPNDQLNKGQFALRVQFNDDTTYIWKTVRWMALLSSLFTLLILLSFGYALYFIFKQKKISQVKNDFINNMTHELKTPLATISLATSSINHPEIVSNPTEIARYTGIIDKERQRINGHIERVLEIAALEKGEFSLQCQQVDLNDLVMQSIQNAQLRLQEIGGELSYENRVDQAMCSIDAYHFTNVLNNLLDNSIKYKSKEKLMISVHIQTSDRGYVLRIQDNGIGMSAQTVRLAFDKFYRAESGNIHETKGFGLGLSYAKKIVEMHKGEISINSQLNEGTTVQIILPKNA